MKVFLGALVILVFLALVFVSWSLSESRPGPQKVSKAVLINLDSNPDRLQYVLQQYRASDLNTLPLERFRAVVGRKVDPGAHLTPDALVELRLVEKRGYRTKHHQLTRGGIGCYLSHLSVLRQIKPGEVFLVLEDDIDINPSSLTVIKQTLQTAPRGWDLILLGYNSFLGDTVDDTFIKVRSFWGTCAYLITYEGAQKFLKESGDRFDCQIDTFMGWMAASGLLNVYTLQVPIVQPTHTFDTNIQANMKVTGIDSFKYRDKILQLN